jgi:osmotically inducible lipoprotein OsmB
MPLRPPQVDGTKRLSIPLVAQIDDNGRIDMLRLVLVTVLISFGLAACGESRLDRGASGAGIGAAAGAATSGLTGGSLLGGALLGGAAGGAAGALTKEKDLDLGEPIWK